MIGGVTFAIAGHPRFSAFRYRIGAQVDVPTFRLSLWGVLAMVNDSVRVVTGVSVEILDNEVVVLDPRSGLVHRLTGMAAQVVQTIHDGAHESAQWSEQELEAISVLADLGIVEAPSGLSRRSLLTMAAAGAAVGVVTLALPGAAAAASVAGGPIYNVVNGTMATHPMDQSTLVTFTQDGSFDLNPSYVTSKGALALYYLLVGGGGAGGFSLRGADTHSLPGDVTLGGGGGGGQMFRADPDFGDSPTQLSIGGTYIVTVGGGGVAAVSTTRGDDYPGGGGGTSSITGPGSLSITAAGGGGGGAGSGGIASGGSSPTASGSNPGGALAPMAAAAVPVRAWGYGGVPGAGTVTAGGNGAAGLGTAFTGVPFEPGPGGGGGGGAGGGGAGGTGGFGTVGGAGGVYGTPGAQATAGTPNSGAGGGGGGPATLGTKAGDGTAGIVIIRYTPTP